MEPLCLIVAVFHTGTLSFLSVIRFSFCLSPGVVHVLGLLAVHQVIEDLLLQSHKHRHLHFALVYRLVFCEVGKPPANCGNKRKTPRTPASPVHRTIMDETNSCTYEPAAVYVYCWPSWHGTSQRTQPFQCFQGAGLHGDVIGNLPRIGGCCNVAKTSVFLISSTQLHVVPCSFSKTASGSANT